MSVTEEKASLASPDREVATVEREVLSVPEQEFDQALVERLDKAIDAYKKIVGISIKLTNPWDWSDIGGKPYLQCSGAEKIASPFKVSMGAPTRERLERVGEDGKAYYIWLYQASFTSSQLGRTIVAQGKCSSHDQFFGKEGNAYKDLDDVCEEDVMQAAYTNCFVNGVTRLLGIRNLTWEQLASGGIAQDKVGKVSFRKGGQGGGQSAAASSTFATTPQIQLILRRASLAGKTTEHLLQRLETLGLPKDVNKIPKEKVDEILQWLSSIAGSL